MYGGLETITLTGNISELKTVISACKKLMIVLFSIALDFAISRALLLMSSAEMLMTMKPLSPLQD